MVGKYDFNSTQRHCKKYSNNVFSSLELGKGGTLDSAMRVISQPTEDLIPFMAIWATARVISHTLKELIIFMTSLAMPKWTLVPVETIPQYEFKQISMYS